MDENLAQEDYFSAFSNVINDLDPTHADFEFQHTNLRNAVRVSGLLTPAEQQDLQSMLHIVFLKSKK